MNQRGLGSHSGPRALLKHEQFAPSMLQLAEKLRSADVQVTLIKDGDHRLSRDSDIALLLRTVAEMILPRGTAEA